MSASDVSFWTPNPRFQSADQVSLLSYLPRSCKLVVFLFEEGPTCLHSRTPVNKQQPYSRAHKPHAMKGDIATVRGARPRGPPWGSQRRIPDEGWSDSQVEHFVQSLAQMDSNNYVGVPPAPPPVCVCLAYICPPPSIPCLPLNVKPLWGLWPWFGSLFAHPPFLNTN